jgi:hypothetical protein
MRCRNKLSNTTLTGAPKFIHANSSTEIKPRRQFATYFLRKYLFFQRLQVGTVLLTSPEFLLSTASGSVLVIRIRIQEGKKITHKKKKSVEI